MATAVAALDRSGSRVEADNRARFAGSAGHVESWFWRCNDPLAARAFWCKATVYAPLVGLPLAQAWAIGFDGQDAFGHRDDVEIGSAQLTGSELTVARCRFGLGQESVIAGECGELAWQLNVRAQDGPLGEPLSMFPSRLLLKGGVPKSKLLTPLPSARFDGWLQWRDQRIEVASWTGMQGHNWGKEHAAEYVWGQCLFDGAMVEALTGRIRLAGCLTPPVSALVVRTVEREWRFDALLDLWRQDAVIGDRMWTLRMRNRDATVELTLDGSSAPFACLGYRNPDGSLRYCWNTKLARCQLVLTPAGGPAQHWQSAHGGGLEVLRPVPDENARVV